MCVSVCSVRSDEAMPDNNVLGLCIKTWATGTSGLVLRLSNGGHLRCKTRGCSIDDGMYNSAARLKV